MGPDAMILVFWMLSYMQVRKQQLELDMEQQTGSKMEKEYIKADILSPCLFNFYAEYIMRNFHYI